MVAQKSGKLVLIISTFLLVLIYVLDTYLTNTEELLYKKLEASVLDDMSTIATNVEKIIQEEFSNQSDKNLFLHLKDKASFRTKLEDKLSFLISSKIHYIYLIYKDENQKFRYLIDGSIEDRARFNQKIDVEGSEYYDIYSLQETISIKQNDLETLSLTFLYPFIRDDKVQAILVFDFSTKFEHELRTIISPLKTMFMLIYLIISVFLVISVIQSSLYFQARKRSYLDELTGCYNRQYLRYFLDTNDIEKYEVIMIDFDHFKQVNDNYGHDIGDKVLVFGANAITSAVSKKDKVFRYGGEEFIVLAYKNNLIENTAENIRKAFDSKSFQKEKITIHVTVSIGVNPVPSQARNTSEAISIADSMLYKAKTQGRNRVVKYNPAMKITVEETHSNTHNIHNVVEALEDNRLICCFHKIVDKNNTLYKYEALVRYMTSQGEMIYPNHFLPDIMHTNVYVDLTKRVIDICIDTMNTNQVSISMNLNINDLYNSTLIAYLTSKVKELKHKNIYLTVEILENEKIENINELQIIMKKMHSFGIRFAIDDFGSGYANFNYLIDLEIDYIKIDGYLVQSAAHSDKSKEIVKAIISLAHGMGVKTIVEFVSSKEIQDMMESLGTDYLQGFYISKPSIECS